MKFLLLFFLFLPLAVVGQDVDSITKIVFHFNNGHNNWGETQQYAESETIEFIPDADGKFICNHFEQIKFFYFKDTSENGIYKSDTTVISHPEKFKISREQLYHLWTELNSNKDNFTSTYILPFLKPYSKKEILELAESNNREYLFTDDKTNKVDEIGAERIRKIQKFYLLDSFMDEMRPDTNIWTIITDVWSFAIIRFFQKNEQTIFDMRILPQQGMLLGQPINKRINDSSDVAKRVINLKVNKALTDILPDKSFAKPQMAFNSIREAYFRWLLKQDLF